MTEDLTTPISPDGSTRPRTGDRFAAGETLAGRYRIVRRLGAGGMGEVYEVEDVGLHETVALKTIRREVLGDAEVVRRFRREIQLARKVTHGNVCRIHDLVEVPGPNGTTEVFLTMELLKGEPLDGFLRRRGRLEAGECGEILKQVAAGLAAAHQAGIVHRDFKPANVIVVPGEQGAIRAVVTDFGLARTAGEVQGTTGSLTGSGQLLGSPAYMAPEQVTGKPITPATDVYAFGVAAYELLTGQRPFRGDNALAVAMMRVREEPPRPRDVEPSIPDAWERLILKCLKRNPSARFRDGEALLRALREPTADDEMTLPGGAVNRGAELRLASKGRRRVGGLLGLLLLVVLWFGWRAWTGRQRAAESVNTVALVVAPFNPVNRAAAEEAATTTTILVQELRRRLERFPAVRVSVGASEEPPSTEGAAQRLGDRLRADVLIWGDVFSEGQRVVLRPKALRMARRFGSTNSISHPPTVMSSTNEADPLSAREARARTTAALALSLVADELAIALGDQVVLGLLRDLDPGQGSVFEARLLVRANRERGAPRAEDWRRSVDLLESAGTEFPTVAVDAHRTLAGLFDDGCRLDLPATFCDRRRAARELERALELEPDDVRSLRLAARFAAASADIGLAIRHMGRLHEIDPTSPATIADLVSAHEWAGRDADAERLLAEIEGSAEADLWAAFMLFRHGRYEHVASGAPSAVNSEVVRRILALGARGDFSGSRREYEGYMRSLGRPGFWAKLVASVRFAAVAGDESDIDVLARRPTGESNPGMYADVVRAAYADVLLWEGRVDEARAILAAREGPESVEERFWTAWMAGDIAAGWKDLETRRSERERNRSLEADVLTSFFARRAGQAADAGDLLERAKRRRVSAIAERGNGRHLAETYDAASLLNDPAAPRMPVEAYLDVVRGAVDASRAFDVLAGRPLRTCRREWTCWLAWYLGTDRLLAGDTVDARALYERAVSTGTRASMAWWAAKKGLSEIASSTAANPSAN